MSEQLAIDIKGLKKQYRLGQIGGGTLTADLQSWWARVRGKEDPNSKIGSDQRLIGQTFMALNGIDLQVKKGEALGIIGGNGAGKSTMLKILSRITAPTEGSIDIYGRIASMLEVGTGFSAEMTGRENIYMNGAILGMTKAEIDAKMEEIIDFSEVREFIDTPVKRYSSGMYVKLAFSVAAHLDSEIMIMDEVLAVGDMAFQKKCLDKMRDAATVEGKTVLYVSHNMNTIRKLCDRCIVLDKGRIIFDGDVEEAIGIYLQSENVELRQTIDLTQFVRGSNMLANQVKMTCFAFREESKPLYKQGEVIKFALHIDSEEKLYNVCFRCMVYCNDKTPVCMASSKTGTIKLNTGENSVKGIIDTSLLAPGSYYLKLALYLVDRYGTQVNLDVVDQAVAFTIEDIAAVNNMSWSHQWWGHVRMNDIVIE